MIRRPPRSTLDRSSAASDVYKRQFEYMLKKGIGNEKRFIKENFFSPSIRIPSDGITTVSYTHLRAHETVLDLVCRLLLEKKNKKRNNRIKQIE